MVPSVTISDREVYSQQFYRVTALDEDTDVVSIFRIAATYIVTYTPDGNMTIAPANSFWRGAFSVDPFTGYLSSFGKLNAQLVHEVILTIMADDSSWAPPQYDFKNLTVYITNG
jgi:hypothetical protein